MMEQLQWKHVVALAFALLTIMAIFAVEHSRRARLRVQPEEQRRIRQTLEQYGSEGRIPDRMNVQQDNPGGTP